MLVIVLAGLHSYLTIRQEIFPDFEPPVVLVEADVPGFSAERIERSVLLPVERAVKGLPGIVRVETSASDGLAQATIELSPGVSEDSMLGIVKSRIDGIDTFPEEIENIVVLPRDDRSQFMWMHLHGDRPLQELGDIARKISSELQQMPAIDSVQLEGLPNEEIVVEIDGLTLRAQGLSFSAIADQLADNNRDADAGIVRGDQETRVVARAQSPRAEDIASLPIIVGDAGQQIPLGELARIDSRLEEPGAFSRLNGQNAVGFALFRSAETTPVAAADSVRNYVAATQGRLPTGLHLSVWLDESRELKSRFMLLGKNGLLGLLLVFSLLLLLTHWRIAVWVSVGIPVAYLGGIWALQQPGIDVTLNAISLFGFMIVSGILVDDALVVSESIYSEFEKASQAPSAIDAIATTLAGVKAVVVPATFGVLTTIAAFFPLTLLAGELGAAIGSIALVVVVCLIFSIVESKLVLPAHIRHSMGKMRTVGDKKAVAQGLTRFGTYLFRRLLRSYQRILTWVLDRPRLTLGTAVALLVAAIALVASGRIPVIMLPEIADFEVEAEMTTSENASLAERDGVARAIETALFETNRMLRKLHELDYDPVAFLYTASTSPTITSITAELASHGDNPVSTIDLVDQWRRNIPDLPPGYGLSLSATAEPDDGINIQLEGADYATLLTAAGEVRTALADHPGVSNIRDNLSVTRNEYLMALTPEARLQGVTLETVSTFVREALLGLEVQRIQLPDRELKVMLRYPTEDRRDINRIMDLQMQLGVGRMAVLGDLIDIEFRKGLSAIQRIDGSRAVIVLANNDDAVATADEIMDSLEPLLEAITERFPELTYRLEGEAKSSDEISVSLMVAMALAIVAVFALLALPLQSYAQPLWVMLVIPFSVPGVIAAHLLFAMPISLASMFGSIALIGVLVNDSLVLIYKLKQSERQDLRAAIEETCKDRFRPIVLTSVTTFCGMMPIIFETDPEAAWLAPIAVSLGLGVLYGTLATLLLLPAAILSWGIKREEPAEAHSGRHDTVGSRPIGASELSRRSDIEVGR
ncbi:MAG: efflux RND transporter permease subunit [Pseudomonadota bacterium]